MTEQTLGPRRILQLKTGSIVTSHYNPNERYVVQLHPNRNVTVRRETPKVHGKAARRADKLTRRLERERSARVTRVEACTG